MSTAAPLPERAPRRSAGWGWSEGLACATVALLAAWFYFWSAGQPTGIRPLTLPAPQNYYAYQAAGFRAGHLYLALEPHPALLAMKDPYDPVANAPYRVHDLSIYRGHYYMYFGATPVLLLFWPVAALTGAYLTEPAAVALFCTGAVWTGIALLFAARRRHYPGAPGWVLVAASACLAFATPLTGLVEGPQFYQVPISCAIFLQALMLAAVYRALHSQRRLGWLAVAGLLLGLSLGARPNYLLGFLALLVPVAAGARAAGPGRFVRTFLAGCGAAFAPALLCGLAILTYNWARFGQVSEFGMHYQLAGERVTQLTAISPRFILPHYRLYLFGPGHWQSYFPFFAGPSGQPYGLLRYIPWAWLGLFAFVAPPGASGWVNSPRRLFALTVAVASAANLTLLASFFGSTSRYPGDYAQAALLLAGLGALAVTEGLDAGRPRVGAAWALGAAAVASLLVCFAVYARDVARPDALLGLARAANWPNYAWHRMTKGELGGLRLDLALPAVHGTGPQPLFESGRQGDERDWLQIEYLGPAQARLGFFHAGVGVFEGRPFAIPADRHVVVEVHAGALFPPFAYPAFASWSRDEYDEARRNLQVSVNGTEVIRTALDCYESSPADLRIGHLGWFTGGMQQEFTGEVLGVERLPLVRPTPVVPALQSASAIELTVYLPSGAQAGADPLVVSGKGSQSDLLSCVYDGPHRVKFAFDHWGNGGPQSETVSYDPLVPHRITVWMASIAGEAKGRLVVLFDGQPLLNTEQVFYPASPESVVLGYNPFGATGAGRQFTGQVAGFRPVSVTSLPALGAEGSFGAVQMSVVFPLSVLGTNEPLVVTGESGAGDFIYVRYVDAAHVVIGFDHWGIGGVVSPPIEIAYGETHALTVTLGSLYPAGSALQAARQVRVTLDGRTVLSGAHDSYPSSSAEIEIGKNQIGGSTCGPSFSGRIVSLQRLLTPPQ
jgi:hypothetical protein